MTHHDRFSQAVNTAAALRAQEGKTCDECGGLWWYRANRIWHEMSCSQNVLNKKSAGEGSRSSRTGATRSPARSGASAADVLPSCGHGYVDFLECPGCTDAADRHNERVEEI